MVLDDNHTNGDVDYYGQNDDTVLMLIDRGKNSGGLWGRDTLLTDKTVQFAGQLNLFPGQ